MVRRLVHGLRQAHNGRFKLRMIDETQDVSHELTEAEAWRLFRALADYLASLAPERLEQTRPDLFRRTTDNVPAEPDLD